MSAIDSFSGQYRWLSNFWPCKVCLDGQEFPSVEHAYQAAKWPPAERHRFLPLRGGDAKRLGQQAVPPPDWEAKKIDVMRSLIQQKFAYGSELSLMLCRTGDAPLIEGNTWGDVFWGVCNGLGENWLGKLLMEQREIIQKQREAIHTPVR